MSQLKDILTVPSTYEEAYYHNDEWCKSRWRAAIKLELDKMAQYKVWHVVPKSAVPKDRRLIKSKWVFDIKRTGIFRARLVACGYSQIPGIDFDEYYSPVVNDAVFRIIIILQILWGLTAVIIDIETAFLHGDLNESIYMLAPKGTNMKPWECAHLDKALYGLVQAARQFYLKFTSVLKQLGFTVSYADPCLFYRNNKFGVIIMVVHIDDCYVVGDDKAIKQLNLELHQKGLKTKLTPQATDYLSCEIKFNASRKIAWIAQPTLMGKMIKKFGPILDKMGNYTYKTPGTPGYSLIKPEGETGILNPNEQTNYRSGVGTLLQFANKTRPDISNAVRELSRGMDKATKAAEKEMYRIMKYLVQTKDYGLKLFPKRDINDDLWTLTIYSDSDWASNKDDRKSITGFTIFLQDAPIMWKSQAQKTVSLSSTEAEYYATSEAAKEIKFIVQVLESLNMKVKKPIIVFIDNVGAIFVAENQSATKHTRHIDARYHFVREYIIDGVIKVMFVQSKKNKADLFTKNVTGEVFEEHVDDFIIHREVIETTTAELSKYRYFDSGGVSGSEATGEKIPPRTYTDFDTSTNSSVRTGESRIKKDTIGSDMKTHAQDIISGNMKNYKSNSEYISGPKYKNEMQHKLISYLRTDGTKGNFPANNVIKDIKKTKITIM